MCGGTGCFGTKTHNHSGLSPRVRGNRNRNVCSCSVLRSIPACAGEPQRRHRLPPGTGVYPRVCGGTSLPPTKSGTGKGLSPRVRGNQPVAAAAAGGTRSIPACAGEPCTRFLRGPPSRVYPRVCGGTVDSLGLGSEAMGLSPRVRGNLCAVIGEFTCMGSIPACAGEPYRQP